MVRNRLFLLAAFGLAISFGEAQTVTDMAVLKGLSPVTALYKTGQGQAALAANYTVTGGIQNGTIRQPTLLPFSEQQQQALRDASITDGNLAQLADGLGTTLGSAYLARAHYTDRNNYSKLPSTISNVIIYATTLTQANSTSGKYFFANATTNGTDPVSPEAQKILKKIDGQTDMFGKNYNLPAGSPKADRYGNSRPFQTETDVLTITGPDYFNTWATNRTYNSGPIMNLIDSPSFPSGHTTYGYTGALLLALLTPERYQQMIARGAEYGNDRILMGAHYAMDVLGGRTLALYDMAHMLANDKNYVGQVSGGIRIDDFRKSIEDARRELATILSASCGEPIAECAVEDTGRLSNPAANQAFYDATQTYNLPVVYPQRAKIVEDVAKLAPEAGYLLTAAYPMLSLEEANKILTETEGTGGGFLDDGSSFGVYSRLNLYAAAGRAASLAAKKSVSASGQN